MRKQREGAALSGLDPQSLLRKHILLSGLWCRALHSSFTRQQNAAEGRKTRSVTRRGNNFGGSYVQKCVVNPAARLLMETLVCDRETRCSHQTHSDPAAFTQPSLVAEQHGDASNFEGIHMLLRCC